MSIEAMPTTAGGPRRRPATWRGCRGRSRARAVTPMPSVASTRPSPLPPRDPRRSRGHLAMPSSRRNAPDSPPANRARTTIRGGRRSDHRTSAADRAGTRPWPHGTPPNRAAGMRRGPRPGCSPSALSCFGDSAAFATLRPPGSRWRRAAEPSAHWRGWRWRSSGSIGWATCLGHWRRPRPPFGSPSVRPGSAGRSSGWRWRSAGGWRGSADGSCAGGSPRVPRPLGGPAPRR